MDGGTEAVNAGLVRVAAAFCNAQCREAAYISTYNGMAKNWRKLAALAGRPNAHATRCYRICTACRGSGCRACDYGGNLCTPETECPPSRNCETCEFARLCRVLNIVLQDMPTSGPWERGYEPPTIPDSRTREGRLKPGQIFVTSTSIDGYRRNVGYVLAILDRHDYIVLGGTQEMSSGPRNTRSWLPPTWADFRRSSQRVFLYRTVMSSGNEVVPSTSIPLTVVPPDGSWRAPTDASILNYDYVREAIAQR